MIVKVLFLLTCVFCTIDTRLFVYPSLSRSLLMETGLLAIAFVAIVHSIVCRKRMLTGYYSGFVLLWVAYILAHGLLTPCMEAYRTMYLCITVFSVIPLSYCLKYGLLQKKDMVLGVTVMVAIQLVYVYGQLFGILQAGNSLYRITGCNDNPTVTAIFLTGSLPFMASGIKAKERTSVHAVLPMLTVIAIVLLRCRTAYIGMGVEALILVLYNKRSRQVLLRYRWQAALTFAAVAGVAAVSLYSMKRDSANGRLLTWRLSAEMIAEKPQGHGYGLFARNYNLKQAEYFSGSTASKEERQNATFTFMAYNDYLEHGVDGGIAGMLFLAIFYVLTIRRAMHSGDIGMTALLAAFTVMSLTNFVCSSIQPWLLVVCASAIVTCGGEGTGTRYAGLAMLPVVLFATCCTLSATASQLRLKQLSDNMVSHQTVSDTEYAGIERGILTSEAFWRVRASNQMRTGDYGAALKNIGRALQYTMSPVLLYMAYHCHAALGRERDGIPYIKKVYHIQPTLLLPKLLLMRHSHSQGDIPSALRYAQEITVTGMKVESSDGEAILREAERYIEKYNKNNRQK